LETRQNYPYFLEIPTRWIDNDIYGHANNAHYYAYFDTVIGHYLVNEGGLDYVNDQVVGFAIENQCRFKRAISFPDVIEAGLRVGKIGNSSVRYELGLFTTGYDEPAAVGYFVHVFVDLANERRSTNIPPKIRAALEKIVVEQ
jgi:acyl-CoA thioester hydrolase